MGARGHVRGLVLTQAAPRLEAFLAGGAAMSALLPVGLHVAAQAGAVHETLLAD